MIIAIEEFEKNKQLFLADAMRLSKSKIIFP
jgi:hypothetical protein